MQPESDCCGKIWIAFVVNFKRLFLLIKEDHIQPLLAEVNTSTVEEALWAGITSSTQVTSVANLTSENLPNSDFIVKSNLQQIYSSIDLYIHVGWEEGLTRQQPSGRAD